MLFNKRVNTSYFLGALLMLILSHGLDTVKLAFIKPYYDESELSDLNLKLHQLYSDHRDNQRIMKGNNYLKPYTINTLFPLKTNINNISIYSNQGYSSLELSLSTIVNGSNIIPLEFDKVESAIQNLNLYLGFDCSRAVLDRVDYNFNIGTTIHYKTILDHIYPTYDQYIKELKMSKTGTTMYVGHGSHKLCIYSQTSNPNYSTSDLEYLEYVKDKGSFSDLVRFEYRLLENNFSVNKHSSERRFIFEDLLNDELRNHIKNKIDKISSRIAFADYEIGNSNKPLLEGMGLPLKGSKVDFTKLLIAILIKLTSVDYVMNLGRDFKFYKEATRKSLTKEIKNISSNLAGADQVEVNISCIPTLIKDCALHSQYV